MDKRSKAANHNLCHFSFSDGRRCRMLRHREHPGLSPFHSREERQRLESERIGTELGASLTGGSEDSCHPTRLEKLTPLSATLTKNKGGGEGCVSDSLLLNLKGLLHTETAPRWQRLK